MRICIKFTLDIKKIVLFGLLTITLIVVITPFIPKKRILGGQRYTYNISQSMSSFQDWLVVNIRIGISCEKDYDHGSYLSFSSENRYYNAIHYSLQYEKFGTSWTEKIGCKSHYDVNGVSDRDKYSGKNHVISSSGYVEINNIMYQY